MEIWKCKESHCIQLLHNFLNIDSYLWNYTDNTVTKISQTSGYYDPKNGYTHLEIQGILTTIIALTSLMKLLTRHVNA